MKRAGALVKNARLPSCALYARDHLPPCLGFKRLQDSYSMRTSGNTILITGGASGLGFALAEAFISAGNEVVICGRTQSMLDVALHRLPALRTFRCDVAQEMDRTALLALIQEHFPRLNMLVNHPGIGGDIDLSSGQARASADAELTVDLHAPIMLTMGFLPHLLKQEEAAIVNITTALAAVPEAAYPAYCAARAGLRSFSKSLRNQLQDTRVEVFEVGPPVLDAEVNRERAFETSPRKVARAVLNGLQTGATEIHVDPAPANPFLKRLLPQGAASLLHRFKLLPTFRRNRRL
jgi:uncharacterized oxidoreductase